MNSEMRFLSEPFETEARRGHQTVRPTELDVVTDEPKEAWKIKREHQWRQLQEEIR